MGEAGSAPAPSGRDALAWLDVRGRRVYRGARVPVELSLRDGALVLRVTTIRLQKRERQALVRLGGDGVLSTLIAKREEPEIAVPLAGTEFRYPQMVGAGRTAIRFRVPDRPPAVLTFVDPEETGSETANPYGFLFRLLRAGPSARRTRDAWRDAIEAAGAGTTG